jgi:antitoxin component YwqK of YwqJK toxin-antitoxin module
LKGFFVDGLEDGEWIMDMGDYREAGSFIEGLKQGEWKHYYITSNKLRFKGNYVEGFPDGKHVFYYESGKKMLEGKYQMGDKQGEWKRYNEDGLLFLTIDYKDGRDNKLDGRKIKPETDE